MAQKQEEKEKTPTIVETDPVIKQGRAALPIIAAPSGCDRLETATDFFFRLSGDLGALFPDDQ